jgi:hypothetical protein
MTGLSKFHGHSQGKRAKSFPLEKQRWRRPLDSSVKSHVSYKWQNPVGRHLCGDFATADEAHSDPNFVSDINKQPCSTLAVSCTENRRNSSCCDGRMIYPDQTAANFPQTQIDPKRRD